MKGLYIVPLAAATLLLSACATTVKPTYVSPTQYQSLSCQQLQSEYNRIQQYIDNGVQTPKVQVWVLDSGLAVAGTRRLGIRPIHLCQYGTIFFNQNTELSRVLGQQEAIVQAAQFKNCPIIVRKKTN